MKITREYTARAMNKKTGEITEAKGQVRVEETYPGRASYNLARAQLEEKGLTPRGRMEFDPDLPLGF